MAKQNDRRRDRRRASRPTTGGWPRRFAAALTFYTVLPVPAHWSLEFRGIARWGPAVGLAMGGLVVGVDAGLAAIALPPLTRSVLVILVWAAITGGLHLDGVVDTADGLSVQDPRRRLQVMADSTAGAFGAIALGALLLLKVATLADLMAPGGDATVRWLGLLLAPTLGRTAQVLAIARYRYLKPTGKGAFHKASSQGMADAVPGLALVTAIAGIYAGSAPEAWRVALAATLGGGAIAWGVGAWFAAKFGGHTGDTYGATVEWTEALLLLWMVGIGSISTLP